MKFLMMIAALAVSGYFLFTKFKPAPPPPPPPPPPVVAPVHIEPTPVISEEEQSKIVGSTRDQDPEVRWQAILLLDKMKAPAAYPVMFERLRMEMEPSVKVKIIVLLSSRNNKEVTQKIVTATKDSAPEVRVAALQALEKLADYNTTSAIAEALKDSEDSVRLQALRTLNALQDRRTAEIEAERKRQEELQRRQAEEAAAAAQKR